MSRRGSRLDETAAYHAESILYLPAEARFDYLLNRPEAENIGAQVNAAMRAFSLSASTGERAGVRCRSSQLAGVLPKTYNLFTSTLLKELLKKVSGIPASLDYDAFGRIYEYFLGEFAMSEGQGGRVKCELRSPKCEVPSIRHSTFVIRNLRSLSIHGVEKTDETGRLCRLNLAVHGLEGEIKHGGGANCELRSANDERSFHE